jgi:uncharacterized protein RhaS with RHS repeats
MIETDLYYYRSRYYDLQSGRFLNEDPEAFLAGHNFYVYVADNPVLSTDPSGLCSRTCGLKEGPAYSVTGQVKGGTPFSRHAIFMNDENHDPACCEVRQYVSWIQGVRPELSAKG